MVRGRKKKSVRKTLALSRHHRLPLILTVGIGAVAGAAIGLLMALSC